MNRSRYQTCLLAAALMTLPAVAQAQFNYITNNGTIYITQYTGSAATVIIPDTINGLPVTDIGDGAFAGNQSITNVTIPDSVTRIGVGAFAGCKSSSPPYLPHSGGLADVTIGSGVTNIGDDAFFDCGQLTRVVITANAPQVGADAFAYYPGGQADGNAPLNATIYCLFSATGWSDTFAGLPTVRLDGPPHFGATTDGWGYVTDQIKNTLIIFYTASNNAVVIPSFINGVPVTGIGRGAFAYDGNLTSLTVPSSVTSIGASAFVGCSGLTGLAFPNVTRIGAGAFTSTGLTNVTIPHGVASIENEVFNDCESLTNVTLGSSVTSIGEGAFASCYGLTSVTVPDSVTSIGAGAFFECPGLTNVTLGSHVTNIGDSAFYDCEGLTSVTIPASVKQIGDLAFQNCANLKGVYFRGDAARVGSSPFLNDHSATIYYLPGTLGWSNIFAGLPTAQWFLPQPLILNQGPGFGVQAGQFGFTISWATNVPVVVEASTNLSNPGWLPVSTNTLTGGTAHFSDPQSSNYPARCYRLRSP